MWTVPAACASNLGKGRISVKDSTSDRELIVFGFISSVLINGWPAPFSHAPRSSQATADPGRGSVSPVLHTMANNTSHGPRNRFGWPQAVLHA